MQLGFQLIYFYAHCGISYKIFHIDSLTLQISITFYFDSKYVIFLSVVLLIIVSTRIWDSPTTGDIRLTGGNYSNEGLLEVYCNGEWGTVCDDFFAFVPARVACRQLGYNDYTDYNHLSQ